MDGCPYALVSLKGVESQLLHRYIGVHALTHGKSFGLANLLTPHVQHVESLADTNKGKMLTHINIRRASMVETV